jgi:hypothetical protein
MKINNPYQVSYLVEAQATYYPNMISVFISHEPKVRRPAGFNKPTRNKSSKLAYDADFIYGETSDERSIRRSKKQIRDYALCNSFDMFATFTFKADRQDVDKSRKKMSNWLKNQRNRNGKFRYLIIPEYHKDGKSLHFHALMGDYPGKISKAINPKTEKPVIQKGKGVYTFDGYTLGFNNVKLISDKTNDAGLISSYIQKYITKDMPVFSGNQRYWVSKGLLLPLTEDNPEKWYEHVKPDWSKNFPNGKIMRFNIGRNELVDMFWEAVEK